jgi:hypothetical protein
MAERAAGGRPRPQAPDERAWEVGRPRGTGEAAEQGRAGGRGGGGGKGAGQGQRGGQNAPRTQSRARRAKCARPRARGTSPRRHDPRQEPSALDAHAGICAGGRPIACMDSVPNGLRAVPTARPLDGTVRAARSPAVAPWTDKRTSARGPDGTERRLGQAVKAPSRDPRPNPRFARRGRGSARPAPAR